MDEVYGWLVDRYDGDTREMKASSKAWLWAGFTLMIAGVGVLGRLLPFVLSEPGSMLAGMAAGLPSWLPDVGFGAAYLGLLLVLYGLLLRRAAKRFDAF